MFLFQRRNPNKERYWKAVVDEAEQWQWLYSPLERLDYWMLKILPFMKLLCWNVVIIGQTSKKT
jgi:hypothetical protein